jgi:hypothetical protein
MAEPDQFALHPPMSPARVLSGHSEDELFDRCCSRRTPGPTTCGVVPFPRDQLSVPSQDRGSSDREDLSPAATWHKPGQSGQPCPVDGPVADPGDLPAQHGVLVPQHHQLRILAQVFPHQHSGQTEQPAHQMIEDRQQQHPTIIHDRPEREDHRSGRCIEYSIPTGQELSSLGQ